MSQIRNLISTDPNMINSRIIYQDTVIANLRAQIAWLEANISAKKGSPEEPHGSISFKTLLSKYQEMSNELRISREEIFWLKEHIRPSGTV